jgi:thiosulfate/3-mercaptopyruvate sulfurtransferase
MSASPLPLLVDTNWLAARLGDSDLRVFDCSVTLVPISGGMRPQSGYAAWAAAHIPGSGYVDLIDDLADRASALPFMMPPAAQCAAALGRWNRAGHARGAV